jgi:hypothetical protein
LGIVFRAYEGLEVESSEVLKPSFDLTFRQDVCKKVVSYFLDKKEESIFGEVSKLNLEECINLQHDLS